VPGHLEGLVALCRVLADQLDEAERDSDESRFVRARIAVAYQASLLALLDRTAGSSGVSDGAALDQLLELLSAGEADHLEQLEGEVPGDAAAVRDAG
jgi:hypothetical protein